MPDLSRGPMIDLADAGVEPSNTAEAGGQCHIAHPQICLVNELLRKVHLASFCHRARSRAQVLEKQATEVTRANSKTFRERFDATVFQATFADQAQGTRNRIWSSHPCWSSGRAFGPAVQFFDFKNQPGRKYAIQEIDVYHRNDFVRSANGRSSNCSSAGQQTA